jgi:hypothetical protein
VIFSEKHVFVFVASAALTTTTYDCIRHFRPSELTYLQLSLHTMFVAFALRRKLLIFFSFSAVQQKGAVLWRTSGGQYS